jgi:hypothetical protein
MALLIIGGALLAAALGVMWSGFVLSILWGWFMVPLGLPALGVAQAIGIALVAGMLTHQMPRGEAETSALFAFAFLAPLFSLAIGWVVKSAM